MPGFLLWWNPLFYTFHPGVLGQRAPVHAHAPPLLHLSQIVIADGGSRDDTVAIVRGRATPLPTASELRYASKWFLVL